MVKLRVPALPKQDDRKSEQHRDGLEALLRRLNAQPSPLRLTWQRDADASAAATSNQAVWTPLGTCALSRAALICDTTEAPDASDFATFTLQLFDAADTQITRVMGSFNTARVGLTGYVAREFELDRTEWPARWTMRLIVSKAGSGVQLGRIQLLIEGQELRR